MKFNAKFDEDLFLTNETGKYLYHTYAEKLPIIDYHCHLSPADIYYNKQFEDLGELWLAGDHYKWRAMRTFGIDEKYITGSASYYDKFMAFAGILPELAGNPLYIWCALELKRFFGIDEALGPENAKAIYDATKKIIAEKQLTPKRCMEMANVRLVCTTEDPIDTLEFHPKLAHDTVTTLSAFRPDLAMFCEKASFASYVESLAAASGSAITSFKSLVSALDARLKYFKKTARTTVSDNGISYFAWEDYTEVEVERIFKAAREGKALSQSEINKYYSAFLFECGKLYAENGFVMQLHVGVLRDANADALGKIGVNTGFDCVDDTVSVQGIARLLDKLNSAGKLPKTIIYPIDGTKTESYAILATAFCGGGVRSKVQLGAPWWFHDQVYGIDRQFRSVANLYAVSLSVGMLTDSRSFLSYTRHELYRRVFCNYLGTLVESGEYFSGEAHLQKIIENVCYNNAKEFFGFPLAAS